MRLLERFRLHGLGLLLLGMVAFCTSQQQFGLLVLAAALAILSWYVTEGPRGVALPRWAQNALVVAILLWSIREWTQVPDLAETMGVLGRFVLGLAIVKLYGRKQARDWAQLIALGGVMVMAGALQSVEFLFAALVFIYAAATLWTVLLYQLYAGRERAVALRREQSKGVPASLVPPVQPVFGRGVNWQFRATVVTAILASAALSAAVFVIFPRDLSELARGPRFGGRRSGFTEEVSLFQNDRITESRREVFTVAWIDSRGEAARFTDPIYLRGSTFERYDPERGKWQKPRGRNVRSIRAPADGGFAPLTATPVDERFQTYVETITMRSLATDVVFASYAPISISSGENRTFEIDPATMTIREVRLNRLGRSWQYSVKVQPFPSEATVEAIVGDSAAPRRTVSFPVTGVSEIAERVLAKVEGLPSEAEARERPEARWARNREASRALAEWLQGPEFTYTTDLGDFVRVADEDPILSFLDRYRFGHCEYFASSLVALCQSVGVEARLVSGYVAIEWDEGTSQYIVRESNAHAWVEVRTGPWSWMTLDPTPGDTLAQLSERNRTFSDRFRWVWDRLEFLWNSQVVAFDSGSQATIAEQVGGGWRDRGERLAESTRDRLRQLNTAVQLGPIGYVWMGVVLAAIGLVTLTAIVTVRRNRRFRAAMRLGQAPRRVERRLRREVGFWPDTVELLARNGFAKPEWITPAAFAATVATSRPAAGPPLAALVDLYYRARFAGVDLGPAERRRIAEESRRLGEALRGPSKPGS